MHRHFSFFITTALLIALSFSCKKNSDSNSTGSNTLFYGKWKTSYNDTIEFTHENGTDYITYDESMNPVTPFNTKKKFRYSLGRLHIQMPAGWPGPGIYSDYRTLTTFSWNTPGQSFTVQGIEWFLFLSSTSTYFTFTRIP